MITNKFAFSGALGKSQNLGASKFLSVPNTIEVPPEYSLETDVPSVAEFLTSSLNGRLWIFRRSRRFYLAVLRWNEDTQRLVFVTSSILSNENLIMRGVDWILTDKSFIQSSDDEPYFSRTVYETDDTSYIDAIHRSYSFFPEFETWEEIHNASIHIQNPPSDKFKEIPRDVLTLIEFHYYSDDNIQVITNFTPKLCYCNDALYAKGKAHIGRVYLLPRSLSENGDIEDFYLYISPDYLRIYDTENQTFDDHDAWDKLIIAPINENSACFFTPDDGDFGFCKKALNAHVTSLAQLEHLDFSDNNGAIFFDGLTQSNLLLNDSGASLLHDNINYQCKGLRQWIAPTGSVKAVDKNFILASDDNFSMATHTDADFFREKLTTHALPLTSCFYSEKRLAMDDDVRNNKKSINVNKIFNNTKENHYIEWDNIYKFPVHFDFVNVFQIGISSFNYSSIFSSSPLIFYSKPCEYHSYAVQKKITNETYTGEKIYNHWEGEFDVIASRTYSLSIVDGTNYYDSFTAEFIYIDLDSGTPRTINCSAQLPQISIDSYDFDGTMKYGLDGIYIKPCHFHDEHISHSESFSNRVHNYEIHASVPRPIFIDNSIVFQVDVRDYSHTVDLSSIYGELTSSTSHYEKVADFSSYNWNIIDESVKYNFYLTDMQDSYLVFTEKRSNLTLLINTPQPLQDMINFKKAYSRGIFNFYKSQDILTNSNGEKYILKCTHVCWIYHQELKSHYLIILRSEYNPEIFDFDSELERSKFS